MLFCTLTFLLTSPQPYPWPICCVFRTLWCFLFSNVLKETSETFREQLDFTDLNTYIRIFHGIKSKKKRDIIQEIFPHLKWHTLLKKTKKHVYFLQTAVDAQLTCPVRSLLGPPSPGHCGSPAGSQPEFGDMNQGRVGMPSDTQRSSPLSAPSRKDLRPLPIPQLNAWIQTRSSWQMQKQKRWNRSFCIFFAAINKCFSLSKFMHNIKQKNDETWNSGHAHYHKVMEKNTIQDEKWIVCFLEVKQEYENIQNAVLVHTARFLGWFYVPDYRDRSLNNANRYSCCVWRVQRAQVRLAGCCVRFDRKSEHMCVVLWGKKRLCSLLSVMCSQSESSGRQQYTLEASITVSRSRLTWPRTTDA